VLSFCVTGQFPRVFVTDTCHEMCIPLRLCFLDGLGEPRSMVRITMSKKRWLTSNFTIGVEVSELLSISPMRAFHARVWRVAPSEGVQSATDPCKRAAHSANQPQCESEAIGCVCLCTKYQMHAAKFILESRRIAPCFCSACCI